MGEGDEWIKVRSTIPDFDGQTFWISLTHWTDILGQVPKHERTEVG